MTPKWAEFLNPVIPTLNDTVLNFLFSLVGNATDVEYSVVSTVQQLLSLQVANALGRVGFSYQFEGNPKLIKIEQVNSTLDYSYSNTDIDGTAWIYAKNDFFTLDPADEGKNWAKFRVQSTIKGYAYNTTGFAPKVAISFLLAYCLVAVAHVLYSGVTGKSLIVPSSRVFALTSWTTLSCTPFNHSNKIRTRHIIFGVGLYR